MRPFIAATAIGLALSLSMTSHVASTANASACGTLDMECCDGTTCDPGLICDGSTCVGCGGNTQPCCDIETCDSGFTCVPLTGESAPSQQTGSGAAFTNECVPCGGNAEPCCDGVCDSGLICEGFLENPLSGTLGSGAITSTSQCIPCGNPGDPCCADDMCNPGAFCETCDGAETAAGVGGGATVECDKDGLGGGREVSGPNLCVACGQPGQVCCPVDECDTGALCGGEFCEQCGDIGEQCCADNACLSDNAVCQQDVCEPLPAAPTMGFAAFVALVVLLGGVGLYHLGQSGGLTARR